MKFCEKCGNMMLPKKIDNESVLECRECGHKCYPSGEEYAITHRLKHTPRDKIVIIDNPQDTSIKLSKEEIEERKRAILEFMEDE